MRKELSPDVIRQILDLREKGNSYRGIARQLNLDPKCPRKYCVLYGLDGVQTLEEHNREEDRKMIAHLYNEEGMTPSEIARKMHKSAQAVRKNLHKQGLWEKKTYSKHEESEWIDKSLPKPIVDPVFYPERKITKKTVIVNGKKYTDVTEVFGS